MNFRSLTFRRINFIIMDYKFAEQHNTGHPRFTPVIDKNTNTPRIGMYLFVYLFIHLKNRKEELRSSVIS